MALAARFIGFGPALVSTVASSIVLWTVIAPLDGLPTQMQIERVGFFVIAAIVVSSLSRQRSKEVREADERYRTLVDLAPDGIVVTDVAGEIVFANSALATIVGATDPSQIVGRNASDFLPAEDHGEMKRRIDQLMSGVATSWIRGRAIRLDGTVAPIERAGVPLRVGNKRFAQGFVRDLTETVERDEKLDESRRRLQALFDTAAEAILFFDSTGRFIDANPAATALFGYAREEILQREVGGFRAPDEQETAGDVFARGSSIGEATIIRKDGQKRFVESRTVMNVIDGLHVAIVRDITERKEAELAIRQLSGRLLRSQDEERRRIARELHDVTAQNLTAVRLNLARMSRSQSIEALDESLSLVDEVISEIRTLSYVLHPPLIDNVGLADALKWYARGFEARTDIKVSLDIPQDLQLTRNVETTLFRIVQEALANIQRHSDSSVARISIARTPSHIRLSVRDEGKGIPGHLRRDEHALFASGLGIAGIRERAREISGDVTIDSTDSGTTVAVTFAPPSS